jgi:hypothetical protein
MIDLSSEQAFEKSLKTLSCNGCAFFINKKCTEKDAETHNIDKSWLQQDALNTYLHTKSEFSKHWGENIDDYFLCEQYKSKES